MNAVTVQILRVQGWLSNLFYLVKRVDFRTAQDQAIKRSSDQVATTLLLSMVYKTANSGSKAVSEHEPKTNVH